MTSKGTSFGKKPMCWGRLLKELDQSLIWPCSRGGFVTPIVMLFYLMFIYTFIGSLAASSQISLYRHPQSIVNYGNFKLDRYQTLSAKAIESCLVESKLDCVFHCISEKKCYSLNLAAYPTAKGLYLCELLAIDKYRATKKLEENATFHHYSPWVS